MTTPKNPRDTLAEYNFFVHHGWRDPRTLMHIYLVTSPGGEPGIVFFHYSGDGKNTEAVFYGTNGGGNVLQDLPSWVPFSHANPRNIARRNGRKLPDGYTIVAQDGQFHVYLNGSPTGRYALSEEKAERIARRRP